MANRSDRTYKNGEGKLMNVEIIDDSGEIRCTAFNSDVDRLGSLLEVGKVSLSSKLVRKQARLCRVRLDLCHQALTFG